MMKMNSTSRDSRRDGKQESWERQKRNTENNCT